jgi:hypothetical protein
MELDILGRNQRRLPCVSLCYCTFAISTPVYCLRAKIVSYTVYLMFAVMLINCVLEVGENSVTSKANDFQSPEILVFATRAHFALFGEN